MSIVGLTAKAFILSKALKAKAKKALEKAEKENSIDGQSYISFPAASTQFELDAGSQDQETSVKILKIKSYIKTFGGSRIKVVESTNDVKIYFDMPVASVSVMFKDLKSLYNDVSLGKVKVRKD